MGRRFVVAGLLVLVACGPARDGQGEPDGGGSGSGDLLITTESLVTARLGAGYRQQVAASGGERPYGWALAQKDSSLSWLHIDPISGVLGGTPTQLSAGAKVKISVTDQLAQTAVREFTLDTLACEGDDTTTCMAPTEQGCVVGTVVCQDGTFPSTCDGELSTSVDSCGPSCSACGPEADNCATGSCACGEGPPCEAGQRCCGGVCVAPDAVEHCGACNRNCGEGVGANVAATCTGGTCSYACQQPWGNCAPGSVPKEGCPVNLGSSLQNCGACNHPCTTDANTAHPPTCSGGVCKIECKDNRFNCDATTENGCETPRSVTNCAGCGDVCHPAGSDNVAAPTCVAGAGGYACQPSCNPLWGNCDGQDSTGCETPLNTLTNCGKCGQACTTSGGATASCSNGTCYISACPPGRINCDGNVANGCEKVANACGCGCPNGSWCDPDEGCKQCNSCGGVECCTEGCQYCPGGGRVQCGPCIDP